MKILAIIPARGGSKGVPGKNIYNIDGKPLIGYTIEAALNSKELSKIIVSSDSDEILHIARNYTGIICHKRPDNLAGDTSPIVDTIVEILNNEDDDFEAIIILQPTSPIRTGQQIDEAIYLLFTNPECNAVISVVPMNDVHPARMYWKSASNDLNSVLPEFEQTRRQDIPTAYYRNGSMYIVRTEAFKQNNSVMAKPALGYVMPFSQLLNIDEPRDILIAEVLISAWKEGTLK
jgi:CMP-N,N'-diacetyllegionaminic acid synthase